MIKYTKLKDTISRQMTIKAIEKRFFAGTVADINPSWRLLHEIIESLPPVEPKRPRGEWIYLKEDETLQPEVGWYGICKCSNCGEQESFPIDNTTKEIYGDDYCRTCGADMRGAEEDDDPAIDMTIEALYKPTSDDLIIKGAKGIKDGLYNIQNGELFQYKAKGGTARAYQIVEALQDDWTPVSEGLPEVGRSVLISDGVWTGEGFYGADDSWHQYRWDCVNKDVIAWRPLPEPYVESEDE